MAEQVSRRRVIATAAGMAASAALPEAAIAAPGPTRPNILFILADDLGYADLVCYGRREYRTPAIDRIAAEGVRFTQAYANSAVCSATRVGLITGRYQNRLPIGLEEPLGARDVGLPPAHPTLPSLLSAAGYDTSLIGKWHLGALPRFGPLRSGYRHFWGFRGGGLDYFRHDFNGAADLWDDDRRIERPGYLTDLLGDAALATIERCAAAKTPFFISLHFNAPHWPWEGPDDQADSRRIAASKGPLPVFDFDGGSMATFAAMVTRMDFQVGRLLATLDRLGLGRDTIVVFTSDNGGERYSDTWPFSGRKTELLEGGLRIPAVARWPGRIAPGRTTGQVAISMDWLPTLTRFAGTAPDPAFPSDGIDLAPWLTGDAAERPRTLCWRYLNLAQEACRDGDWKYLKILGNRFLFNVADDPMERANLKDRRPDIYAQVTAKWREWNARMLPLDPAASTSGFTGAQLPDHYGVTQARTVPE